MFVLRAATGKLRIGKLIPKAMPGNPGLQMFRNVGKLSNLKEQWESYMKILWNRLAVNVKLFFLYRRYNVGINLKFSHSFLNLFEIFDAFLTSLTKWSRCEIVLHFRCDAGIDSNGCWLGSWCQDMSLGGCPGKFLHCNQQKSFGKHQILYLYLWPKGKMLQILLHSLWPDGGLVSKRGSDEMSKALERRRGKIFLCHLI